MQKMQLAMDRYITKIVNTIPFFTFKISVLHYIIYTDEVLTVYYFVSTIKATECVNYTFTVQSIVVDNRNNLIFVFCLL